MSTNNTKPEGKEINAFRFMQKKIGENLWRFPQGYSQSTIFGFMEEFAQLSPSDHTAPQGEEEAYDVVVKRFKEWCTEMHSSAEVYTAGMFLTFLKHEGFTIQKKQPLTKLSDNEILCKIHSGNADD